jgi:type VI secretion system (T6SS) effector TldE1-like protein
MPWIYEQITGRLISPLGGLMASGYSGAGVGKNNPTEENVQDAGPIPVGYYDMESPINSPIHGPFAIPLLPDANNFMFGRFGFLIHGDSLERPGDASEGCIIMPRFAREAIWNSTDHRLQVVRQLPTKT